MTLLAISYPSIDGKDFDWIQNIRREHDRESFEIINPHFTLVFPVNGISQEDLTNHTSNICAKSKIISFSMHRAMTVFDKFSGKWFTFIAPLKGFDEIAEIHSRLYTGILQNKLLLDVPYVPHITVGKFDDENSCRKLTEKLNKERFGIEGTIDSINIVSLKNNKVNNLKKITL